MNDPIKQAIVWQRTYFQILDRFFRSVTNTSAAKFSSIEGFPDAVRSNAHALATKMHALSNFEDELKDFYSRASGGLYDTAFNLGGNKLVLGGSSRFLNTHLKSVVVNSLYCDTILIPDPVMPWMEIDRSEERFQHVQILEAVHVLLHLRPLADADLINPTILIFPSWEKKLELGDPVTQRGMAQLIGQLVSCPTIDAVNSIPDLIDYVRNNSEEFLKSVETRSLLIAPGESEVISIKNSVKAYEDHISKYRSEAWLNEYSDFPIEFKVFNILMERYGPQYHLLENAFEFSASPLVCVKGQSYCFEKVSLLTIDENQWQQRLTPATAMALRALSSSSLQWLNNIPIESLAALKADGTISDFRLKLNAHINTFDALGDADSDRVASDFAVELRSLISNHNSQLRTLQAKYARAHGQTAFIATAGLALNFLPILGAPITATAAIAALAKYGKEKADEVAERNTLRKSLVGVLSLANN